MGDTDELIDLDDHAWTEAQAFWQRELASLENELDQVGEWSIAGPPVYGDGVTPIPREVDDQTICFAHSERLDRAFKVQQFRQYVASGMLPIAAWVRNDDPPPDIKLPDVLQVVLQLTDQTAALARSLLRKWMDPATTRRSMDAFIERTPAGSWIEQPPAG